MIDTFHWREWWDFLILQIYFSHVIVTKTISWLHWRSGTLLKRHMKQVSGIKGWKVGRNWLLQAFLWNHWFETDDSLVITKAISCKSRRFMTIENWHFCYMSETPKEGSKYFFQLDCRGFSDTFHDCLVYLRCVNAHRGNVRIGVEIFELQ